MNWNILRRIRSRPTARRRFVASCDALESRIVLDGTIDLKFGAGGFVTIPTGHRLNQAGAVLQQKDGGIVVVGRANDLDGFIIARRSSNGSLDNEFGTGGIATISFPGSSNGGGGIGGIGGMNGVGTPSAVAMQSDGKIVVVGASSQGLAAARLNQNGSLDTNFDGDGFVTLPANGSGLTPSAVAIQSDGGILVAGTYNSELAITRLTTTGALDKNFGSSGRALVEFDSVNGIDNNSVSAIAIQSDGGIVVAGSTATVLGSKSQFAVARLDPTSGALDTKFDGDGKQTISFSVSGQVSSILVQADGKIVLAGQAGGKVALARLMSGGALDSHFGNGGQLSFGYTTSTFSNNTGAAVAQLKTGKLIVVGTSGGGGFGGFGSNSDFGMAQINPEGTLDANFSGDGLLTLGFDPAQSTTTDTAGAVMIQPDGKIVVAGFTKGADSDQFAIFRLLASTSPVPTPNPDPGGGTNPGGGSNPGGGTNPGGGLNPGGGSNPGGGLNPGGGSNRWPARKPYPKPVTPDPAAPPLPRGALRTPPRLLSMGVATNRRGAQRVVLRFDQRIRGRASLPPSLFSVRSAGPDGQVGTADDAPVRIVRASYSRRFHTVTLRLARRPEAHGTMQLVVGARGIINFLDQTLDGNGDGAPGDDYVSALKLR